VLPGADDEREAEAVAVRGGERGEPLVLAGAEPVESRGRLLAGGLVADPRLRAEIWMRADECEPVRARRPGHHADHRRVQRAHAAERPRRPRRGGDPRRLLEHPAEARDERVAVEAAGLERVHAAAP
jgi:hypothetical protein